MGRRPPSMKPKRPGTAPPPKRLTLEEVAEHLRTHRPKTVGYIDQPPLRPDAEALRGGRRPPCCPGGRWPDPPRGHALGCLRHGLTRRARWYLKIRRWTRSIRRLWPWRAQEERRPELPKGGPYR